MLFVWLTILNTHLRFRRSLTHERVMSLPMRLPVHPFLTVLGILLIAAVAITTFFVDGLQWSVPAFSVFLALISLLYLRVRQREKSGDRDDG
jgi:AAT family amino acid transporter